MALLSPHIAMAGIPVVQWTQSSGARVFLVESPAIAMVDVKLDFDAGARRDPVGKIGLASVTASTASQGIQARGAEPALDENALGEAWADLGASFNASASSDRMSFSLRSLTYPDLLPKAVALAARQLGEPSFPQHVWLRDRQRMVASIKEANTRPATVAGRAFAASVYGGHPYGNEVTEGALASISIADMQALYARVIQPCRAVVTIVGAVTRAQADALVSQLLSRLPSASSATANSAVCPAFPAVPEVPPLTQPKDERLPFDSAQAHVLIGQPGFKRADPDFFALTVGNYILGGGGFVSRLTAEVREKRGLSYSVYSYFAPALHAGAFTIGLQTRPDQANQAVQVSRDVLAKFVAEGPTQVELKAAKDNLIGGFALRIDSNAKLLDNVANIAWNNLALDYLDTWTQQVDKVTLADIKAAFARKLQPERMVTVVVGGVPGLVEGVK
jgi:zinc protease